MLLAFLVVAVVCIRVVIFRAQPILRARVIETLSARFKSQVELADLHVWVADGVHVDGKGLKIYGTSDPNRWEAGVQPLLEVGEFRFQTGLTQPVSRADARGHRLRERDDCEYSSDERSQRVGAVAATGAKDEDEHRRGPVRVLRTRNSLSTRLVQTSRRWNSISAICG